MKIRSFRHCSRPGTKFFRTKRWAAPRRSGSCASIAERDTPSPLEYQFALLRKAGFREIGLLHKNIVFGAYYAVK